ncbi:MAG: hypothetical protein QW356_05515 [Candidatus Hadarchaeales archaeon]
MVPPFDPSKEPPQEFIEQAMRERPEYARNPQYVISRAYYLWRKAWEAQQAQQASGGGGWTVLESWTPGGGDGGGGGGTSTGGGTTPASAGGGGGVTVVGVLPEAYTLKLKEEGVKQLEERVKKAEEKFEKGEISYEEYKREYEKYAAAYESYRRYYEEQYLPAREREISEIAKKIAKKMVETYPSLSYEQIETNIKYLLSEGKDPAKYIEEMASLGARLEAHKEAEEIFREGEKTLGQEIYERAGGGELGSFVAGMTSIITGPIDWIRAKTGTRFRPSEIEIGGEKLAFEEKPSRGWHLAGELTSSFALGAVSAPLALKFPRAFQAAGIAGAGMAGAYVGESLAKGTFGLWEAGELALSSLAFSGGLLAALPRASAPSVPSPSKTGSEVAAGIKTIDLPEHLLRGPKERPRFWWREIEAREYLPVAAKGSGGAEAGVFFRYQTSRGVLDVVGSPTRAWVESMLLLERTKPGELWARGMIRTKPWMQTETWIGYRRLFSIRKTSTSEVAPPPLSSPPKIEPFEPPTPGGIPPGGIPLETGGGKLLLAQRLVPLEETKVKITPVEKVKVAARAEEVLKPVTVAAAAVSTRPLAKMGILPIVKVSPALKIRPKTAVITLPKVGAKEKQIAKMGLKTVQLSLPTQAVQVREMTRTITKQLQLPAQRSKFPVPSIPKTWKPPSLRLPNYTKYHYTRDFGSPKALLSLFPLALGKGKGRKKK